jgi:hypothetical protein
MASSMSAAAVARSHQLPISRLAACSQSVCEQALVPCWKTRLSYVKSTNMIGGIATGAAMRLHPTARSSCPGSTCELYILLKHHATGNRWTSMPHFCFVTKLVPAW